MAFTILFKMVLQKDVSIRLMSLNQVTLIRCKISEIIPNCARLRFFGVNYCQFNGIVVFLQPQTK